MTVKRGKIKQLWKFFIIFFFFFLLIFNWHKLLLLSNYRVFWHNFSLLFTKNDVGQKEEIPNKANALEIPKIKVSAPLVLGKENDFLKAKEALDRGVLLYLGAGLPGEKDKTVVILGHSAPAGWPEIHYDNVFNNLSQLEPGDEVLVYFNQKKYAYRVFGKKIFFPKDESEALKIGESGSFLILITCWPPGKDYQRLAVFAELKQEGKENK